MKVSVVVILLLVSVSKGSAQTCCTGGVPHLGGLKIPQLGKKEGNISLTYFYNRNQDLFHEDQQIEGTSIIRNVSSFLLQGDYGIGDKISASVIFPYLVQKEALDVSYEKHEFSNRGVGDISFWVNYRNERKRFQYTASAGIKLPTGNTDQRDPETGFILPLSFQNGSGSVDLTFLAFGSLFIDSNKKYKWINQVSFKLNSKGKGFEAHPDYRFGNSLQWSTALSGTFIIMHKLVDISSGLNYQYRGYDTFKGGFENNNTGGQWINIYAGGNIAFSQRFHFSMNGFLPAFRRVNGLQLTTSWIVNAGINYKIG